MKKSVIIIIVIILVIAGLVYFFGYKRTKGTPTIETFEITKKCKTFRLASVLEWEERGFLVTDNIAYREGKEEFNINETEICFENIDCVKECSETDYNKLFLAKKVDIISGILSCICTK